MGSGQNNSTLSSAPCAPDISARTQACLEEMKGMNQRELSNVIILIGRTGVGKSALLEYLTNTQGHSKDSTIPATREYQLERLELKHKRFYIMDTPGFDTNKEESVFKEIVRGINAVRQHAKIVGVMLVSRINDTRAEAVDDRLVRFVDKMCNPGYTAQITAVTNFWNVSESEEEEEFKTRLRERLEQWRGILGQQLKQYQHGRKYSSSGEDVGPSLKWRRDSDDIKSIAQAILLRHYDGIVTRDPGIIRELSENKLLHQTAAGRFLGIAAHPTNLTSTPTSSTSLNQSEATYATKNVPRSVERGPPSSSHSTNSAQDQNDHQNSGSLDSLVKSFLTWVGQEILVPVCRDFTNAVTDRVIGRWNTGGSMARSSGFPSHLDYNSNHDHFIARGLPGDLAYRTAWAQERGIFFDPGSEAFGNAVLNAIKRENPL